ncbi:MAG: hypothetical protein G01um101424_187 [Parcubacteria group bacterium Gr01-1014_24]|nr:MAG: hypothetical protein G01um101424_187 [Parcubacteria group bacterium Gr01-1014_24]
MPDCHDCSSRTHREQYNRLMDLVLSTRRKRVDRHCGCRHNARVVAGNSQGVATDVAAILSDCCQADEPSRAGEVVELHIDAWRESRHVHPHDLGSGRCRAGGGAVAAGDSGDDERGESDEHDDETSHPFHG